MTQYHATDQTFTGKMNDFSRTVRRDFTEIREFYLDQDRRDRLKSMSPLKRFFVTLWWLLKSLYFKLTSTRRVLLLIGILLTLFSGSFRFEDTNITVSNDTAIFGFAILLFVLALELKDKLLAHDELKAGHAVQEALMPKRTPEIPGWELWMMTRSANDVGGDLLDFLPLADGRCCIALGDVAGKGLPAALFMGKLQATLRALRFYSNSLPDFLKRVNEVFHRDKIPHMFASLVYLEIDPASPAVHLVNAGHFLPFLVCGGKVQEVPKSGPGLGIIANANYLEHEIIMGENDLLLIYSDGLSEARNPNGEFFGEQRLAAMLPSLCRYSCTEAGERILTAVQSFMQGTPLQDDLTLLLLRRKSGTVS